MAKKALVSTIEPRGKDNSGYRVVEVVEIGNEFEVHSNLQWKNCDDSVRTDYNWFDPNTSSFKKLPEAVDKNTAGELAVDAEGNLTEEYEWNWDTETWSKVQIINQ
jgi:hypothetical protein